MLLRSVSALLFAAAILAAQPFGRPPALRDVGLDQRLDAQIPLDLEFTGDAGTPVRFGHLLRGRPILLSLVYYRCPMLCNLVLNAQTKAMRNISLQLGRDYDAITVSFDPAETAALAREKKAAYIERFTNPGAPASWHFLTGSEQNIRALAAAVGFRYAWDAATQQWAHASGIVTLTPEGRVSRYLYGIEYPKQDVRLALVEASHGKIASTADRILLFCFHYDPSKGKYGFAILNTLRVAGVATLLAVVLFIFSALRRERRGYV